MPDHNYHQTGFDTDMVAHSAPVILIGRGGGGTRLLSQIVSSFGIFMGNEINVSFDSVEWVNTIYKLVIESLTDPFEVGSERDVFWQDAVRAKAVAVLNMDKQNPADPWGWKLPETTLIVPQVIRYFPNARFVHLIRHPIASCCRRTHMTSRMNTRMGAASLTAAYAHIGRAVELIDTDSAQIHNAASWAHQVDMALDALEQLPENSQKLLIKYEDICSNPKQAETILSGFLSIDAASSNPAVTIDSERMNSQADSHPDAPAVWDICQNVASRIGYQWTP
jgi:hypothetical protein